LAGTNEGDGLIHKFFFLFVGYSGQG